ncbi:shikimate kinase [Lactococcus termiticola]|uniref:Shikimate kinase n=1 Tax=Lactococcus termiticola TaxID=2169526 RepID=A0A2R5HI60_9LACT|nr:shikimate kinase [Lactococcus termiticola]GBG95938.1 shikimate kinase [Lactococcus termiticola]
MPVILIGFMGVGKTSLAYRLDPNYIDLDRAIERKIKRPIAQFFERFGEAEFRKIEHELLASYAEHKGLIATGGGIVEYAPNLPILEKNPQTIYLKSDFEDLYERIKDDPSRPLTLQGKVGLKELFERRAKLYEAVASQTIDVSQKTPDESLQALREVLGH